MDIELSDILHAIRSATDEERAALAHAIFDLPFPFAGYDPKTYRVGESTTVGEQIASGDKRRRMDPTR